MRIGIIGPTENEIMPFIDEMMNKEVSKHAMVEFYTGVYKGVQVVSAFSGVCKVNAAIATQVMIDKFEVTHIILTGVAGALNKQLNIGDVVIGSELVYHDVAAGILTEYHPWMKDIYIRSDSELIEKCQKVTELLSISNRFYTGRIITGETFITHNEREVLIENFNPLCVDMESASVAHTCYANNIPFIVIRSMSDNADENGSESFQRNVKMAALNSLEVVKGLVRELGKLNN